MRTLTVTSRLHQAAWYNSTPRRIISKKPKSQRQDPINISSIKGEHYSILF